ncbi:hypothetical protein HPP92_027393 [Vanilla planifolia]|uniref:Uncharacterized protein n=1 Tax=Vanilla planifolia TaxID=51239 RepID=A0A835U7S0_VANPL|nr:hypothetical protein HPP92_027393 [Vanilla planifolia]
MDVGGSFASFTATISLHRDLLGVPRGSTFRQYSRITISIENTVSAAALNSGNRLIKSYDLVAVRALNQMAFDRACQTSEVDIIALDLSQKLPFRLKLPMVQSSIKRGLHFEICSSHLIADSHTRRQVLSDAKLLGDWTRGKNLIISSAANSFNEVRGPHAVANLATVFLGITMERAKAAASRNCRSLLANALRKKDCYFKEAIKVERFLPEKYMEPNEDWFKE